VAALAILLAWAAPGFGAEPRLTVVISVDGLPWWRLDEMRPWYVAGLKRLLDEGQVFSEANYRHINTETGPGHSALSTGAPPRITGIPANEWAEADGKTLRVVNCVDQPLPAGPSRGPAHLRVPTLGDRLVESRPGARVVSLSAKDRSAILLAGRRRQHSVYWYDQDSGRFTTSLAYDPPAEAKALVEKFNRTRAGATLPERFGLLWKKLPPPIDPPGAPVSRPTPAPDLYSYQIPSNGLGFDHAFTYLPRGYFASLYVSPASDELLTDLALAFLASDDLALGRRADPDILALSFSAHDVVSHSYGVESDEELDTLRRLDAQLGRLFAKLQERVAKINVALAFSADHGFPPIPEAQRALDRSFKGGRLLSSDEWPPSLYTRLNRLLDQRLCLAASARPIAPGAGWALAYDRPELPLKRQPGSCGEAGAAVGTAEIDAALPDAVATLYAEEVSEVLLVSQRESWSPDDPATEFARNDLDLERSGDAFLIPRYGVQLHWDPARGSTHGTQYPYDTHVPLIFWGGGFSAGSSPVASTPYDLAPTLAKRLGLSLPDAVGTAR
jgi:hypothetical protein